MMAEPNPPAVPILRPAALRSGYSDGEIQRLRRRGTWTSIRRGSYLPTATLRTLSADQRHELLVRGTVSGLRVPAVVSHASAAVLLGIPLWSTDLKRVHVSREKPSTSGRSGGLVAHSASFADGDVITVQGITVTSPSRTLSDLARLLPFEQAVVAADGALHRRLLTPAEFVAAVGRVAGSPGARPASRVARFANGKSESVGESRSRVMMAAAGLPIPELQRDVFGADGQWLGRSDFAWLDGRLLGEFDGRVKYGRLLRPGELPGDAVFREKLREDAMRDSGARMVRWTWSELAEPAQLAHRIGRRLIAVDSNTGG